MSANLIGVASWTNSIESDGEPPVLRSADCYDHSELEPVDGVLASILALAEPVRGTETLALAAALGRVIASDVVSPTALPGFDNSAVDGFGLSRSEIDRRAPFAVTLRGRVAAGGALTSHVGAGEAVRMMTGAPVPEGVCAVVPQEYCRLGSSIVIVNRPVALGANVRRRGEDVALESALVRAGSLIDARHVAILAAVGCTTVTVRRRVRVALLSTGNELCKTSGQLEPAMIHDSNRPMLGVMLSKAYIDVTDFGICPDAPAPLADTLARARAESDVIITSGGASGSEEDHIAEAIAAIGGKARRHRLALKPGKPLIVGDLGRSVLLALPGNPVAALVSFMLFGRPLLATIAGTVSGRHTGQAAVCGGPFAHVKGRREFVPAAVLGRDDIGRFVITKCGKGGSARLLPLVLADGLAEIPAEVGDLSVGSAIVFLPFQGETAI